MVPSLPSRCSDPVETCLRLSGGRSHNLRSTCPVLKSLGTWADSVGPYFSVPYKLRFRNALIEKLQGGDCHRRYVVESFLELLPDLFTNKTLRNQCTRAISTAMRLDHEDQNDLVVRKKLIECWIIYPEEWQDEILENIKQWMDPEEFEQFQDEIRAW